MLWHADTLPPMGKVRTGICGKARMKEGGKTDFRAWYLPAICWDYLIVFDNFKNSVVHEKFSFPHKGWPVQNVLQFRKKVPEI